MDDFHHLANRQRGTLLARLCEHTFGFFSNVEDVYWRPGWHALIEVANAVGGLDPRGWFAVVVALLLLLALALFFVLTREGAGRWLAALGAIAFAVAPGHAEGIAWISAALNVLPCALLLLWCGRALLHWLQGEGGRFPLAAFLLFVASLTFKEAGYHVPLLIVGGALALGATRRRSLATVLGTATLFGLPILLHFHFANRISPSALPLATQLASSLKGLAAYTETAAGARNAFAVGAVALVWLALLVSGSPRTRFFLVWAPLATFPYLLRAYAFRFSLFVDLPLCAGVVLGLAERARGRSRVAQLVAGAPLVALIVWNLAGLPAAQRTVIARGELCRAAVESVRAADLAGVTTFAVDDVPPALLNGLKALVEIHGARAGAPAPATRLLGLFRRPPFLLHRDPDFGGDGPGVAFFRCDPATCRFTRTSRAELAGKLIPLPMWALRYEAAVVADQASALREIAARRFDLTRQVVLQAEPAPPFVASPGARGTMRIVELPEPNIVDFDVTSGADGFFVLHVYGDLARSGSTVELDGAAAKLLAADGLFNAVRIPAGTHRLRLVVRGNPLRSEAAEAAGR